MSSRSQAAFDDDAALAECERIVGYEFDDRELLVRALTHASAARVRLASNERLEFLGDAVLGTIVCEELFHRYPDSSEGDLTRIKSVVVSRATCARLTKKLGLQRFLVLGKGVGGGAKFPQSILAAVFEAIVAAIYLDSGYERAQDFVTRALGDEIRQAAESHRGVNYKSLLQQLAQRQYSETPDYPVLDEKGPDHSKCFQIAARIGDRVYAPAWGPNKKEAEQLAAANALEELTSETAGIVDEAPDELSLD